MLLGAEVLNYGHEAANLSTKLAVAAIKSNLNRKRRLKVNKNKRFLRHFFVNVFCEIATYMFLVYFVYACLILKNDKGKYVMPASFITFWLVLTAFHPVLMYLGWTLWSRREEWVYMVNSSLRLTEILAGMFLVKSQESETDI